MYCSTRRTRRRPSGLPLGSVTIENTRQNLRSWIKESQHIKPGNEMPNIDLGGDRVPCAKLFFDVAEADFFRPYRVAEVVPGQSPRFLVQGEWRRKPGEEQRPLEVRLPTEARAHRLRLVVTDYRNPPLNLLEARYAAPARQVVFDPPAGQAQPLRLYFTADGGLAM